MIFFDYVEEKSLLVLQGDMEGLKKTDFWFFLNSTFILNEVNSSELTLYIEQDDLISCFEEIKDFLLDLGQETEEMENASETIKKLINDGEDFFERSKAANKIYWGDISSKDLKDFTDHLSLYFKSGRKLDKKQTLSAFHLAFSKSGCNFSVPGAGKTTAVLAAYSYLKSQELVDKILVIGPLACFWPWESEYEKCFNEKPNSLRFDRALPISRKNVFFKSNSKEDLILMHYQSLANNLEGMIEFLKINKKTMVVIDEAHWIKRVEDGVWAEAALKIAPFSASRVILTGTPAPNGYEDLINLFEFIWPNRKLIPFGKRALKNLSELSSKADKKIKDEKIKKLIDALKPYFVRVSKKDLKLPNPIYHPTELVNMGVIQREIYDYIEERYAERAKKLIKSKDIIDSLIKAKTIRLRQAATNPNLLNSAIDMYEEGLGQFSSDIEEIEEPEIFNKIRNYEDLEIPQKFIKTLELVKKILNRDEKVIIWVNFVKNIHKLSSYLETNGFENQKIFGDIPSKGEEDETFSKNEITRESIINEFHRDSSSFKIIIANTSTIGESISLHMACNNAIYIERDFNAASYLQSKDRIHRKGMPANRLVNYYFIESINSVDQSISERLEHKIKNLEEIIEHPIPLFSIDTQLENMDIKAILDNYVSRQ